MSKHYDKSRNADSEKLRPKINTLYQKQYGDNLLEIRNFNDNSEYTDDKTLSDWHDMAGADTMLTVDTPIGAKIIFVEEKVRTYLETDYAATPFDVDLALTLEYFQLDNQPKFKKHIELYDSGMFIPSRLMFVVKDSDYFVHQATLIDYRRLHENARDLIESGTIHTNQRDGNKTLYLNDSVLEDFNLVINRWSK